MPDPLTSSRLCVPFVVVLVFLSVVGSRTLVQLLHAVVPAVRRVTRSFDDMDNRPPPPHVSPKSVWVSKLILRIFSAICALVLIGLAASVTAQWGYDYNRWTSYAAYTLACVAPPVRPVSLLAYLDPKPPY